jgi:hypothetical protein
MDINTTYTSNVERAVLSKSLVPTSVSQGRALPIAGSCAMHGVSSATTQVTATPIAAKPIAAKPQLAFAPGNTTLGGAVAWRERGADLRLRPRTLMV